MAKVDAFEGLFSLSFVGKFDIPNGFGATLFGWNEFGYDHIKAGYYQERPTRKGRIKVRSRHYWPKNPKTENQQAWRNVFAEGVQAWHNLTKEDKQYYNDLKYPQTQSGFTRFMSQYLEENRIS